MCLNLSSRRQEYTHTHTLSQLILNTLTHIYLEENLENVDRMRELFCVCVCVCVCVCMCVPPNASSAAPRHLNWQQSGGEGEGGEVPGKEQGERTKEREEE